jgi:hypothetical protein
LNVTPEQETPESSYVSFSMSLRRANSKNISYAKSVRPPQHPPTFADGVNINDLHIGEDQAGAEMDDVRSFSYMFMG